LRKAIDLMALTEKVNKKIEIPSDIRYIKKISKEILELLQRQGVDKSVQFDVRLAVEEAVRNAIEHGHQYDKKLPITVSYAVAEDRIEIEVEDRGKGFDVKQIPDPRTEEHIMKEGGRGVFLIYRLMDKVQYNKKGNKVKMTKLLK
jgi:serine/threonine-protein kinase RsbW